LSEQSGGSWAENVFVTAIVRFDYDRAVTLLPKEMAFKDEFSAWRRSRAEGIIGRDPVQVPPGVPSSTFFHRTQAKGFDA
jgi:hypothetical protein